MTLHISVRSKSACWMRTELFDKCRISITTESFHSSHLTQCANWSIRDGNYQLSFWCLPLINMNRFFWSNIILPTRRSAWDIIRNSYFINITMENFYELLCCLFVHRIFVRRKRILNLFHYYRVPLMYINW